MIGSLTTRIYAPRGGNRCSVEGCAAPYYGSGFCKKHHQWHWKRGLLPKPEEVTIKDKLLSGYKPNSRTGCWLWIGHRNNNGYGTLSLPGQRNKYAHRVSYEVHKGPIPEGMSVCHRCDTPACINPDHLFLGTHQENMQDAAAKGRAKQPAPRGGLAHHNHKLTPEQVRLIRTSPLSANALRKQLGVAHWTVMACRRRISYRDLP